MRGTTPPSPSSFVPPPPPPSPSVRLDLGGRGTAAIATALPGLPAAASGRGGEPCRVLPSLPHVSLLPPRASPPPSSPGLPPARFGRGGKGSRVGCRHRCSTRRDRRRRPPPAPLRPNLGVEGRKVASGAATAAPPSPSRIWEGRGAVPRAGSHHRLRPAAGEWRRGEGRGGEGRGDVWRGRWW